MSGRFRLLISAILRLKRNGDPGGRWLIGKVPSGEIVALARKASSSAVPA